MPSEATEYIINNIDNDLGGGKLYLRPENYDDLYSLPPTDNAVHGPLHNVAHPDYY
jgi:hypothetical protein